MVSVEVVLRTNVSRVGCLSAALETSTHTRLENRQVFTRLNMQEARIDRAATISRS